MKQIISHLKQDTYSLEWQIQSNEQHQANVARLAKQFADEFGLGDWAEFIGLIHDKGKERIDFQNYIKKTSGYDIDVPSFKEKTHAWIGALIAKNAIPTLYPMLTIPILGHHAGLCDYTDLSGLSAKVVPSEVDLNISVPKLSLEFFKKHNLLTRERQKYIHHVLRMLFSCLVDADFLDTENFMQPEKTQLRENCLTLGDLLPKLEKTLLGFSSESRVNKIRKQIQDCCREKSQKPSGVYSLTVPTGGGKTLSSLLWAMLHAIKNNKRRIIIAIPYTSIISQTANIFKDIFGDDAVLEHHSNYDFNENENEEFNPQKLATENWDAPIVITTNVQLFESMYASHPIRCRKLHNIANSVVILDEVQTLPGEHLQAIVDALKAYNQLFGASILFTTASQPTLKGKVKGHDKDLDGFSDIEELIPENFKLHDQLRRVDLVFEDAVSVSYEQLADRIMSYDRVLCIVNTRKVAAELYQRLPNDENNYHLSRNMCPEHVDAVLDVIKSRLKDPNDNKPIRVITTQLIEAGVDIDFPVVMRQEIGLDSILQAAGRCNREGKMSENGKTYVFKIEGVNVPRGDMSFANDARKKMNEFSDLFSPDAMKDYFVRFYKMIHTFDKKEQALGNENIESLLHNSRELCFDTADKYFKYIEDNGYTVVVNYQNSSELVKKIENDGYDKKIFRKLQRYSVGVPKDVFDKLNETGTVQPILIHGKESGLYYVFDEQQYDKDFGLFVNNHFQTDTFFI